MSEPTKPGYYWAMRDDFDRWQVVEVWTDQDGDLAVTIFGNKHYNISDDFIFGPEVKKPEELE